MAKKKYYTALVNKTDHEVTYAEEWTDLAEATRRVQFGLEPEALQCQNGWGGRKVTDTWAYGPADKPFEWPKEAKE